MFNRITIASFYDFFCVYNELANAKDIAETIILGSSHSHFGWLARGGDLNLSIGSEDLYYSYNLYKLANSKNIKNVILFFSVFTPGLCVIKTQNRNQSVIYKKLFNIDYQFEDIAKENNLYQKERIVEKMIANEFKKPKLLEKKIKKTGASSKTFNPKIKTKKIHERALKHLKNNQREMDQLEFLIKLIEEVKKNNQNFVIVIPPATKLYREVLPSTNSLFKKMLNIAKENNIKVLNYFESDSFENRHFMDGDHLNIKGAEILTNMVRSEIL